MSLDADETDGNVEDENSVSTVDNHRPLPKGWPVVQAKVLKDLVLVTKYMKQNASAVRCVYVCVYMCTYVCICVYVCIYVHMYVSLCVYM